jgi:hypothetical protein
LDYLVSDIQLDTGEEVILTSGTAVGLLFGENQGAIQLAPNARLSSLGTALEPNYFVFFPAVQEDPPPSVSENTLWSGIYAIHVNHGPATLDARWTIFQMQNGLGWWGALIAGDWTDTSMNTLTFSNCQFYGGSIANGNGGSKFTFNNVLFDHVGLQISSWHHPLEASINNCLFRGGGTILQDMERQIT